MKCPVCKADNPDALEYCFNCGRRLNLTFSDFRPNIIAKASLRNSYKRARTYLNNRALKFELTEQDRKIIPLLFLGLLSYIPSVGFFLKKDTKKAIYSLLAFIILIDASLLLIKSELLIFLLFLIASLCIYCASSFVLNHIRDKKIISLNSHNFLILNLIIVFVFFFITAFSIYILPYRFASVTIDLKPFLMINDTLLIKSVEPNPLSLKKGDIVIFNRNYEVLGIIMATAGDTFFHSKNVIYINDQPIAGFNLGTELIKKDQKYKLSEEEYIIFYPYIEPVGFKELDLINIMQITGKAIAIINPAHRRRLL